MVRGSALVALALGASLLASPLSAQPDSEMQRRALDHRIARLEAIKAVERLQFAYGYYEDRFFFAEVASLFAADAPSVQWGDRIWSGRDGVKRFWTGYMRSVLANGRDGPVAGALFDLPQWQGAITVSEDGQSARARYRTIGRLAVYRQKEFWISGYYENSYVREAGAWKFKAMKFCPIWSSRYTDGWQDAAAKDALAWLPPPPASARASRAARPAEECAKPYPEGTPRDFDFGTAAEERR